MQKVLYFGWDAAMQKLFERYDEHWLQTYDFKECGDALIELIHNSRSKIQLYLANSPTNLFIYDSKELKEALKDASGRGLEVKILNNLKGFHFCIGDEKHIFMEDPCKKERPRQVLVKYNTKMFGRNFAKIFERLYNTFQNQRITIDCIIKKE